MLWQPIAIYFGWCLLLVVLFSAVLGERLNVFKVLWETVVIMTTTFVAVMAIKALVLLAKIPW